VAIIILGILAVLLAASAGYFLFRERGAHYARKKIEIENKDLSEKLASQAEKIEEMNTTVNQWIRDRVTAETRLEAAEKRNVEIELEKNAAIVASDAAREKQADAEQASAARAQEVTDMRARITDWEKTKVETINAVNAAAASSANNVSNKLLADFKRENNAAKKQSEAHVEKTTKELMSKMETVSNVVTVLHSQVNEGREAVDTVWNALSSPVGAVNYAEIGLENTLKSFGLVKNRDFFVQAQIEGSRLRPDAIVVLPDNTVMVIDAKASKFFLDLAKAQNTEEEENAYQNLSKSMGQHLTALAGRNYRQEIKTSYTEAGRAGEIERIFSIMYLPSDGALDKVRRSDPDYIIKAHNQGITVASNSSLAGLIGFARLEINHGKRIEAQEQIVDLTQLLLDSVGTTLEAVGKMGGGLKTASRQFAALTKTINGRLLPRVRNIVAAGVHPNRHKPLPNRLPTYQLIDETIEDAIEGESENLEERDILRDLTDSPDTDAAE